MVREEQRALDFVRQLLKPNGAVLIKTYQGAGFQELTDPRAASSTKSASPNLMLPAPRSSEPYLLASGFRMV